MNLIIHLKGKSRSFWLITGLALVLGMGVIDYLVGYELAFSVFYLLPVSLATWFGGRRIGIVISVASALSWFTADALSGHPYSHPAIPYWNTGIRFSFFLIVSLLLSALGKAYEYEKKLARIDNLTGAVNARFFYELVQMEIYRAQRSQRPFTIAYVDLDNFKSVNDRFGHGVGNELLYLIVKQAKKKLRKDNIVARLGGDEFAFLLPETDQAGAKVTVSKVQVRLLDEMQKNDWPVTFSIGVLTCINPPEIADKLIQQADILMYSVKNNGKNAVSYSVYEADKILHQ